MSDGDEDIAIFAWVKRILRGKPSDERELQRTASLHCNELRSIRHSLQKATNDADAAISKAVQELRDSTVAAALEAFELERLSPTISDGKLSILRRFGYRTLSRLQNVSARELQQLPGIGPVTSQSVLRACRAAIDEIQSQPLSMPLPDDIGKQHQQLLAAVGRRVRLLRVPSQLLARLQAVADTLDRQLKTAKQTSSFLQRLWRTEAREFNEQAAHLSLRQTLAGQAESALAEGRAALNLLIAPRQLDELIADYGERFADYTSVLEQYVGPATTYGRVPEAHAKVPDGAVETGAVPHWPPLSSRADQVSRGIFGGVPQEIADRVEGIALSVQSLKVRPRAYQLFGAKYVISQKRCVLGDEMGLGKTIEAMAAMTHLQETEGCSRFLVVAPAGTVGNWCRELSEHSSLPSRLLHGFSRDHDFGFWLRHGGVAVTSYETMLRLDSLFRYPLDMLVVDEAHYVKNPLARRSQAIEQLAQMAKRVTLMTGTPMENAPHEFVNLIRLCDERVAAGLKVNRELVVSPGRFERQVAAVYLRRNQDDVLHELPECIMVDEWVTLGNAEQTNYQDEVRKRNFAGMRRAANGIDESAGKLERLAELLDNYRQTGAKVVLFSFFLDSLDRMQRLADTQHRIDGSVPPAHRLSVIDEFSREPGFGVLVCQIVSGGVGINLHCASAVILMEPQLKPTTEWQAIKRVHRMGQTRRVVAHRVLAHDTVDQRLVELVARKAESFDRYARESVVKDASRAAVDSSIPALEQTLIHAELRRLGAA